MQNQSYYSITLNTQLKSALTVHYSILALQFSMAIERFHLVSWYQMTTDMAAMLVSLTKEVN